MRLSSVCGLHGDDKEQWDTMGYNGRGFSPLWDTTEEVFSIVGYNRRGFFHCKIRRKRFFPFWDTTEEVFLLWDTMEKNDTTENDIFIFNLSVSHCLLIES
jgi:hypothetical protein